MADRRQVRTPFHYQPHSGMFHILTANDTTVGMVLTEQHAAFICKACNQHDALTQIFNLCRGESQLNGNGPQTPNQIALAKLFAEFDK